MTNDPGDRHVIAAAVKCGAEASHFQPAALPRRCARHLEYRSAAYR
jgi:hypothetical protein